MGWQHIDDGRLNVTQSKTGMKLSLKIHPKLQEALSLTSKGNMTFLVTAHGAPFSAAGFGNWFRERCNEAGFTGCFAHCLRKAAARRMAEDKMSADIIKSVTGHSNLKMLSFYTGAANQALLSDAGIDAIGGANSERILSNLNGVLDKKNVTYCN